MMANKLTTKWYIVHDNGKYFCGYEGNINVDITPIWGEKKNAEKYNHGQMIQVASKLNFKNISFEKVPNIWERIVDRVKGWFA